MKYTVEVNEKSTRWYKEGTVIYHRLDGPAIEYSDGSRYWYQEGMLHRLDGPAIESADGTKYWYQKAKSHRLDGPAVEWPNGNKSWYIEGKEYTELGYQEKTSKKDISSCDGKVVEIDGKKYKLTEYKD